MEHLVKYISPVIFLFILLATGCDKQSSKQTAAQALEDYFKNESTLKQTAWGFYAAQNKESELYAYLTFLPRQVGVSRMAPVEFELRRLCPDSNRHAFWTDTGLKTFELVLIKNVQANKGKAKRLLQITCDSSFDLVTFERSTIETLKPEPIIDIESDRKDWYEKIIVALRENDAVRTEQLVSERSQYIDMRNDRGESLLHFCKSGATASLLLDKGAKVDAKSQWGATPLIYAADFPTTDLASVLVAAGADVNHRDEHNVTPLKHAYNLDMAMLLVEHGASIPEDALLNPAGAGRIGLVKYLYSKGALINAKDIMGQTALHKAATRSSESNGKDQIEVAQWLIQQGTDVNALDDFGKTPYDATIWHDKPNQEMLKLLSDNGGKPAKSLAKELK